MPEAIDVLIVEDDPMVAAIHRQFIGAVSGFIVAGVVSSGKDALEFLQRHPVRLVILDVFLPGMDGVATLQKIREMNRTVGVIVCRRRAIPTRSTPCSRRGLSIT